MAGSLFRTAQRCRPIRMVDSGSPPGPIFHPMEQAESFSRTGRAAYRTVHGATSAPEASPPRSVVSVKPAVRPTARRPHDPLNCHLLPRAFVKSVEPERSRSGPAVVDNGLARVRFGIPCPASVASGRSCLPALSGRSSSFLDLQKEDPPNTGRFSRTDIFTRSVCLSPHQAVRREVRIC